MDISLIVTRDLLGLIANERDDDRYVRRARETGIPILICRCANRRTYLIVDIIPKQRAIIVFNMNG